MSDFSKTPFLDQIQGPADLKKLEAEDLPALAEEIRETLINSLSNTGGHLGPMHWVLGATALSGIYLLLFTMQPVLR